jgi:hypothetical protein
MKPLRWLGAGLLWILAGVLGLVGGLLCVTIILLPLGIPVLMLAKKLVALAGKLVIPRAVRHPVKEMGSKSSSAASDLGKGTRGLLGKGRKSVAAAVPPPSRKLRRKAARKLGRRKGLRRLKWWG